VGVKAGAVGSRSSGGEECGAGGPQVWQNPSGSAILIKTVFVRFGQVGAGCLMTKARCPDNGRGRNDQKRADGAGLMSYKIIYLSHL
jgi:hypothetical protein